MGGKGPTQERRKIGSGKKGEEGRGGTGRRHRETDPTPEREKGDRGPETQGGGKYQSRAGEINEAEDTGDEGGGRGMCKGGTPEKG